MGRAAQAKLKRHAPTQGIFDSNGLCGHIQEDDGLEAFISVSSEADHEQFFIRYILNTFQEKQELSFSI